MPSGFTDAAFFFGLLFFDHGHVHDAAVGLVDLGLQGLQALAEVGLGEVTREHGLLQLVQQILEVVLEEEPQHHARLSLGQVLLDRGQLEQRAVPAHRHVEQLGVLGAHDADEGVRGLDAQPLRERVAHRRDVEGRKCPRAVRVAEAVHVALVHDPLRRLVAHHDLRLRDAAERQERLAAELDGRLGFLRALQHVHGHARGERVGVHALVA
jgi:hypothetical protein